MSDRNATEQSRRAPVIVLATVVTGAVLIVGWQLWSPDVDGSGVPVSEVGVGDCFAYPGDGVVPTRIDPVPCTEIHYGEVYATTTAGDTESCVHLFESYTGREDYWDTDFIIGFLDVNPITMHCYLYAASDYAGSIRASGDG